MDTDDILNESNIPPKGVECRNNLRNYLGEEFLIMALNLQNLSKKDMELVLDQPLDKRQYYAVKVGGWGAACVVGTKHLFLHYCTMYNDVSSPKDVVWDLKHNPDLMAVLTDKEKDKIEKFSKLDNWEPSI